MTAEPNPPTERRGKPFWRQLWFWCLMVPVGFYVYAQWEFHRGGIVISRDYVAELNTRIPDVPEDQQAWPVYRDVDAELKKLFQPDTSDEDVSPFDPASEHWPEVVSILDSNQHLLDRVRDASARPVGGYRLNMEQPDAPPFLMTATIENTPVIRSLCDWILADARVAAETGDWKRFVRDIKSALAMSDHASENETTVHQLADVTSELQIFESIRHSLTEFGSKTTEQTLTELFAMVEATGLATLDPETERLLFHDAMQRVYSDTGEGDGYFWPWTARTLEGLGEADHPTLLDRIYFPVVSVYELESRKQLLARYDVIMDEASERIAKPYWERGPEIDYDATLSTTGAQRAGNIFIGLLMPILDGIAFTVERRNQSRTTTLTLLALHRYKKRHSSWPRSLDELVPEFLPEVPRCTFTGKPLGMLINDAGPVLYSVGPDMEDDGGMPTDVPFGEYGMGPADISRAIHEGNPDGLDGDWILWPEPSEE
jgi:hypothetical protein